MSDKPARKPPARKLNLGWVVFALALGMLIWVRLRLVTDIPRSAYAEPRHSAPATPPEAPTQLEEAAMADRIAGHGDSAN